MHIISASAFYMPFAETCHRVRNTNSSNRGHPDLGTKAGFLAVGPSLCDSANGSYTARSPVRMSFCPSSTSVSAPKTSARPQRPSTDLSAACKSLLTLHSLPQARRSPGRTPQDHPLFAIPIDQFIPQLTAQAEIAVSKPRFTFQCTCPGVQTHL